MGNYNLDFFSNLSKKSNEVEDKLRKCEIPYRKIVDEESLDLLPAVHCGQGFFQGLTNIKFYLFPEWESQHKNKFE